MRAQLPPCITYKEFYDREIENVKAEKPGLKLPQYRDLVFKMWERSPENRNSQTRKNLEAGLRRAAE